MMFFIHLTPPPDSINDHVHGFSLFFSLIGDNSTSVFLCSSGQMIPSLQFWRLLCSDFSFFFQLLRLQFLLSTDVVPSVVFICPFRQQRWSCRLFFCWCCEAKMCTLGSSWQFLYVFFHPSVPAFHVHLQLPHHGQPLNRLPVFQQNQPNQAEATGINTLSSSTQKGETCLPNSFDHGWCDRLHHLPASDWTSSSSHLPIKHLDLCRQHSRRIISCLLPLCSAAKTNHVASTQVVLLHRFAHLYFNAFVAVWLPFLKRRSEQMFPLLSSLYFMIWPHWSLLKQLRQKTNQTVAVQR